VPSTEFSNEALKRQAVSAYPSRASLTGSLADASPSNELKSVHHVPFRRDASKVATL
jgi:hypothetical protein